MVRPVQLMWVRINPARLPLLTQRTEEFSRKQCQLWMHASEAMSSGKTPCEGNEIQKGNCRSKLNLYPELKMLLRKLGRCGGVPAEEMLILKEDAVFVQELKHSFLCQPFGAHKQWGGICLFCMRGWQES